MIFETFARMLQHDERIQFTVSRKGNDLTVLIQPILHGNGDSTALDDVQALRAALSMPLYVTTTPQTLDRDFPQSLSEYVDLREQGYSDLKAALARIKESGKQAAVAANQKKDAPAPGSTPSEAETVAPAPTVDVAVTTKSLF